MPLPREKSENKVEIPEPPVSVILASSISGLGSAANRNLILHLVAILVRYVQVYDNGYRICIISDDFDNVLNDTIHTGMLYIATDPKRQGNKGVYLLVSPDVERQGVKDKEEQERILKKVHNRAQFEDTLSKMEEDKKEWTPISFWKIIGIENEGKFMIHPPSEMANTFVPTANIYSPVPGMLEYLEKGYQHLFGQMASDTKHPAYKWAMEMK